MRFTDRVLDYAYDNFSFWPPTNIWWPHSVTVISSNSVITSYQYHICANSYRTRTLKRFKFIDMWVIIICRWDKIHFKFCLIVVCSLRKYPLAPRLGPREMHKCREQKKHQTNVYWFIYYCNFISLKSVFVHIGL